MIESGVMTCCPVESKTPHTGTDFAAIVRVKGRFGAMALMLGGNGANKLPNARTGCGTPGNGGTDGNGGTVMITLGIRVLSLSSLARSIGCRVLRKGCLRCP